MKTTLLSIFAVGTCAFAALAEPVSPVAGSTESVTAEAHAAGPITLTEAEMDQVAAGAVVNWSAILEPENEVPVQNDAKKAWPGYKAFAFR